MPDSNATITRTNLIKRALRRLGNHSPSNDELALAVDLLNDIVKEVDVEGRWLWTVSNTPSTLTLVAGTRSYSVGSGASEIASSIVALERVEIVTGSGSSATFEPLRIVDKSEAIGSYEREGTGRPYMVYLERAASMANQKMHFLNTPDAAYAVQYYFRRRLYDFDSASGNPDFPQDWSQRLVKRLTAELAPEYGVPIDQIVAYHEPIAQKATKDGRAANSETYESVPVKTEFF